MDLKQKIKNKVWHAVKRINHEINGELGLYAKKYRSARGSRILIYHGICKKDPHRFNSLFLTEKAFEKQLQLYKKYYNIISTDDFFQKKFDASRFNIALSFDDGFANNCRYVLPLLEKYALPATFFITGIRKEGYNILWNDFLTIASVEGPAKLILDGEFFVKKKRTYVSIETKNSLAETLRYSGFDKKKRAIDLLEPYTSFEKKNTFVDYWLQLSVDEIKKLSASPLVTIGSHGYFHNDLGKIHPQEMQHELKASKIFLEELVQKSITTIAFPYGSYTQDTIRATLHEGYNQLYATEFVYGDDDANPVMRERMGINPYLPVHSQMLAIIKGNYE